MPASYKPVVKVQGEWAGNALRFATEEEARLNALNLMGRWMLVEQIGVEPSEDPVNYAWVDGELRGVGE